MFLGGYDWRSPCWVEWLYPADMPEEWRLTYYNTQFSCVWLPHDAWSQASPERIVEWVNDTHPGFRFLLEVGELETADERRLLEIFEPKLGLYSKADHPALWWFDQGVNLRDLAKALSLRAAAGGGIYLLSQDGDMATLDRVGTLIGLLEFGSDRQVG